MIARIDSWLLDRFQTVAAWIHRWTGFDCLSQGRGCLGAAGCFGLLQVLQLAAESKWGVILWAGVVYVVAAGFYLREAFADDVLDLADAMIRSEAERGLRNYRRAHRELRLLRMLCTWLTVLFLSTPHLFWALRCVVFFVHSAVYLSACDPQPPSRGKVREWWATLGKRLVPVEVRR